MADRVVADTVPKILELEPGEYWWCRCGRSSNQPFCDGAHKGTDIEPMKFEVTEKKRVALCTCKASNNEPFCDGSHRDV